MKWKYCHDNYFGKNLFMSFYNNCLILFVFNLMAQVCYLVHTLSVFFIGKKILFSFKFTLPSKFSEICQQKGTEHISTFSYLTTPCLKSQLAIYKWKHVSKRDNSGHDSCISNKTNHLFPVVQQSCWADFHLVIGINKFLVPWRVQQP